MDMRITGNNLSVSDALKSYTERSLRAALAGVYGASRRDRSAPERCKRAPRRHRQAVRNTGSAASRRCCVRSRERWRHVFNGRQGCGTPQIGSRPASWPASIETEEVRQRCLSMHSPEGKKRRRKACLTNGQFSRS